MPLKKIMDQVDEVLKEVGTIPYLPKPKKATITFETEFSTQTDGGIKILIFKIGRSWQKSISNETTYIFELIPEQAEFSHEVSLKEKLAKAIKEAYKQLEAVNSTRTLLKNFSVKVSFIIEKSTTVEGEYELSPITPSLGKTWKNKAVHTIEIEFEKEAGPEADVIQVGTIMVFPGEKEKIPNGWMLCDGSKISKEEYPNLFDVIGTVWGGSGDKYFFLPDFRGMFLRGVSDYSSNDPDRNERKSPQENQPIPGNNGNKVGSIQNGQVEKISYELIRQKGSVTFDNPGRGEVLRAENPFDQNVNSKKIELYSGSGNETRPKNAYVYYIIKVDNK